MRNVHNINKERAARTARRRHMVEEVVAVVWVTVANDEGVEGTEDGESVTVGGAGIVVCVDDEEKQKTYYLEIGVGPKRGGALRKCGIREEVEETTAAAGFEVGNSSFKPVRRNDEGVIGVNGDHDATDGLCEGNENNYACLGVDQTTDKVVKEGIGLKRIG
jgi:hypothetical protein